MLVLVLVLVVGVVGVAVFLDLVLLLLLLLVVVVVVVPNLHSVRSKIKTTALFLRSYRKQWAWLIHSGRSVHRACCRLNDSS